MATLGGLKDRIRQETVRDDIAPGGDSESALIRAITQSVEHYQDERFWFKYGVATADTTAAVATVDIPLRIADSVILPSGDMLEKYDLQDLLTQSASSGDPTCYAEMGTGIYLYPTPASALTLTFYGIKDIPAPTDDGDGTTVWTNQAYDLISARAKWLLYAGLWNDPRAADAKFDETEALNRLLDETERRNSTPLRPLDCAMGQRIYPC